MGYSADDPAFWIMGLLLCFTCLVVCAIIYAFLFIFCGGDMYEYIF